MNLWRWLLRKFYPHSHDKPGPITTDSGLLLLMSTTGPIFAWEMKRFGVRWARRRARRLMDQGYLEMHGAPGGILYALSDFGRREVRRLRSLS